MNTVNSVEQYHGYLHDTLRTQFRVGIYKQFWEVFQNEFNEEKLVLIPPTVSGHSTLSLPPANNYHDWFFNEEVKAIAETPVVVDTVPDDDIFGEMM